MKYKKAMPLVLVGSFMFFFDIYLTHAGFFKK
jgi:hypothetical protein